MRCDCCNKVLSDYESTLRHAITREFLNTCITCLEFTNIPTHGRPDLATTLPPEDPLDLWEELDDFESH